MTGVAGIGIVALVKLLGEATVTAIMEAVVYSFLLKVVGREAAKKIAKELIKKVPQKLLARLVSAIGWALVAWDLLVFLPGPARRVTVPCVVLISAERCMKRLSFPVGG